MNDTNEQNYEQESSLDSLIERTLRRDAEATRARFAAVPNERLTAKLALATASRGLFRSLGGKLALYAGGAFVVGWAIYFFPSIGRQPNMPFPASKQVSVQKPSPQLPSRTEVTERTQNDTKPIVSRSKADSDVEQRQNIASPKPTILLDEGDDKKIPTITDKHYQPPLK